MNTPNASPAEISEGTRFTLAVIRLFRLGCIVALVVPFLVIAAMAYYG